MEDSRANYKSSGIWAPQVVILDDNPAIRQVLKTLVATWLPTSRIYSSDDGVQGLGYIMVTKPDIIIIDSTLPRYSGREVIDFLTSNPSFRTETRKVIVLHNGTAPEMVGYKFPHLNKRSTNFVKQLRTQLQSAGVVGRARPRHQRFVTRIINWANRGDRLIEKELPRFSPMKIIRWLLWVLVQINTSALLAVMLMVTGEVKDNNLAQSKADSQKFRTRYLPSLVGLILATIFLLLQIILFFGGGLAVFQFSGRVELVRAGAIGHSNIEVTSSAFTTTTTGWQNITGASLAGSNFTVGDRYLVMLWAYHNSSNANNNTGIRLTHGGTTFTESEGLEETDQTNAARLTPYFWFTVWTAANEALQVQLYNGTSTITARADDVNLVAINVDDLIDNGDLKYDIQTGGGTLDTNFTAKAGIDWTPANNNDTWWIMGYTKGDIVTAGSTQYEARLNVNGTARGTYSIEGEDGNDTPVYGIGWPTTLSNSAQSVDIEVRESATDMQWSAAGVFALRLNLFNEFQSTASAGAQALSAGLNTFNTAGTLTESSVGVTGNWLVAAGFAGDDKNGIIGARIQQNNTTNITDEYGGWQHATTDTVPWTGADIKSYSAASSQTWDLDVRERSDVTPNPEAEDAWMVAFSMEIPTVTVTASGSQTANLRINSTDQYLGGKFAISDPTYSGNLTSVTISENGTINAQSHLDNIKLYYDLDTSAPYDCASESYAGGESQFGSTDADGFSAADGTSAFSGSVTLSPTSTVCLYVVLDVVTGATLDQTIEVEITTPKTQVVASAGSIYTNSSVALSGSTTVGDQVTVAAFGTQSASIDNNSTGSYVGGGFSFVSNSGARTVTGITIREQGSVDAQTKLDNIKIFYDSDTSAPYDCASESYAGGESQFGSTDTDGFSAASGVSAFSGSVGISATSTMCAYVVLDILSSAPGSETIEIDISTPYTAITLAAGIAGPDSAVAISGTSTIAAGQVSVAASGTQTTPIVFPASNQYVGAKFVITETAGSTRNVTALTIREQGNVDAQNHLSNIKLYYDLDTSAPYDCASESYAGGEAQFGTTDANGFSAASGSSGFSGTASISATSTMCVYTVLDISLDPINGQTLEIDIADPSVDVILSSGTVTSTSPVALTGTSTLQGDDTLVSSSGSQASTVFLPSVGKYIGGVFVIKEKTSSRNVTSITIREQGSVNAQSHLDNIKLKYDLDTSNPYDCASESYSPADSQFGSTDTDGFSSGNGSAAFTGSVGISTTSTMCVYVVLDVTSSASIDQTIEIDIADADTDVVVSSGSAGPASAITISGSSTLYDWYNTSWLYRKKFTVDETKVAGSADFYDFPVLINLSTDLDLKLNAQADADDILFTDSTGAKVDHEIEKYSSSTGELVAWVEIPVLFGAVNTDIYMYYGNSGASSQQSIESTWSGDYNMVHHLEENTTSATGILDSTSTNNDSTTVKIDGAGSNPGATGIAGLAVEMDGADDNILVSDHASLTPADDITISFWSKFPNALSGTGVGIVKASSLSYQIYFPTNRKPVAQWFNSSGTSYTASYTGTAPSLNTWNYVTVTRASSDSELRIYLNGSASSTTTATTTGTMRDGTGSLNMPVTSYDGFLDEVRILDAVRSPDWILTEYNNQGDPSTFYSVTGQDPLNDWYDDSWIYRKKLTVDETQVAGSTNFNDFPVLVNIVDNDIKTKAQADADDIFFTSIDGTKLKHEIELFSSSTGELAAWVRFYELKATADTEFYVYYGNAGASNQEDEAGTWTSSYAMVHHLEENTTSATGILDSTSNNNDSDTVKIDGAGSNPGATGVAGLAVELDGSDDNILVPDHASLTPADNLTLSFWSKFPNSLSGTGVAAVKASSLSYQVYFPTDRKPVAQWFNSGGTGYTASFTGTAPSLDTWNYITVTRASSDSVLRIYLNGSASSTTTATTSGTLRDGTGKYNMPATTYDGFLDEMRLLNTVRSADWILTEYNNQMPSSTFISVDSEESSNSDPVLTSITLNGGSDITLTENTTTSVSWTASVTDNDGYANLDTASGKLFRSAVGSSCTPDDNNCYSVASCSLTSCSGNSCTVTCTANVQFYAEPTDSGAYSAQSWQASIDVIDDYAATDSETSSAGVVDMDSLIALNVTSTIDYGTVYSGNNTGAVNQSTVITNTGNIGIDTELSGTNLCSDYPTCAGTTIAVTNQEYNLTTFTFGAGTDLTTSPVTVQTNAGKPTTHPSNSTKTVYWGVSIPGSLVPATYTGNNTVVAVTDT